MMINIQPAQPAYQSAITQMLRENNLIYADIAPPHLAHFLVARVDGALAGVVGLELFGAVGLLRSLVVRASLRGRGYGQALVAALERHALGAGARELFLLTETAPDFLRGWVTRKSLAPMRPRLCKPHQNLPVCARKAPSA